MGQMPESDDHRLLAEFVRDRSETAFTELVRRYAGLVHSTAFRFCGNPHHAEEITQSVFVILARKAETLSPRVVVSGWLYQTARLTAANFVKGEMRRRRREQEAVMQSNLLETGTTDWGKIAPLLDDAMGALGETDRNAVLLRYFENRTSSEIGVALRMNEETARKRVNRALDKLRHFFVKRGVTVTSVALSGAISANSVQPISAFMVKSISAIALAKGATASTSTLTLIKGALKIMAWTKAKTAIVIGVVAVLTAGTTMVVIQMQSPLLDAYLKDTELNDISNAPPMVAIQPTHFNKFNPKAAPPLGTLIGKTDGTREIGRNISLSLAILEAYGSPDPSRSLYPQGLIRFYYPTSSSDLIYRTVYPKALDRIYVDYLVTVPDRPHERFQAEIKRKFGWTAHVEMRETDVLLLKVKRPNAPGLTPADDSSCQDWSAKHPQKTGIQEHNVTASRFAENIEDMFTKPVIDRTGLNGNYDFITGPFGSASLNQVFDDQLGLELVATNMPMQMLVVEKAK